MGFKWLPQWRKLSCGPSWLWNRPVRPPLNLHNYENGIIWSSQHLKRHLRASHDTYRCEKWILGPSQQWNRDLHSSENGFIWSSQHLNRCPRALHDLYSCEKWICGTKFMAVKDMCTSSTGPAQCTAVKRVYLIFPALKQASMIITQPLQFWKLNFKTFKVLKQACTSNIGPTQLWKWLYLSFMLQMDIHKLHMTSNKMETKLWTFMTVIQICTTSSQAAWQWKQLCLIFPAIK